MRVTVRYFAIVRERLGSEGEPVELGTDATLDTLRAALEARRPALAPLLPHVRFAVNREMVGRDHALADGDEVALIPPVAGGAGRLLDLSAAPIDAGAVIAAVAGPDAGAVAVFVGTVRAHNEGRRVATLVYEAYREMAGATFARIADEAAARFGARVGVAHRVGTLAVGDVAVVVAAAAPHRAAAFDACRFTIDALKERAPIWKKEIGPDGETWIGMGP